MKRIHILGNKDGCLTRHFHPLTVFRKDLLEIGIDARFFYSPEQNGIDDCDSLIFFEPNYRDILPIKNRNRDEAINYLSKFLSGFPHSLWFDDRGCSGWLRSYVFPYVEKYFKSQYLENRDYYTEEHLTGSLHRDYVNEQFSVADRKLFKDSLSLSEIGKIRLGWNTALINWPYFSGNSALIKNLLISVIKNYRINYSNPNLAKRSFVSIRGNLWKNEPTVNWWRQNTFERVDRLIKRHPKFMISPTGKVSKKDYYEELRNSIVTPSPFGIGEICYRDFECFFCGSLLFKANMDHLVTYPDLFIDGVTYISHKWDFSDFDDKFEAILAHPGRYEEVAREGQRRFREALSDGNAFAKHFEAAISV